MVQSPPALRRDDSLANPVWRPRLELLLAQGVAAGADLVEVFLERTDVLGVLAEQDTITSVSPAFGMGAGVRVFRGGRDGFVSTNDLGEISLHAALDEALAMLELRRSSSSGPGSFQGLTSLRDFALAKQPWLDSCPDLTEATARLLQGTH
ncbi:MAG: PmbA/TldA family metallopeptidase, partial [Cyanobium sp.]